jgi:hypothetical protein
MNREEWVPDEEGSGCSVCHSVFSLTKRRHHCRKCGALVCGSCSDHFVALSGYSVEVRVCDPCEIGFREASIASEKMDITAQISFSLKQALKGKSDETELFNSLFLQTAEGIEIPNPTTALKLDRIREFSDNICFRLQNVMSKYNDLKMSSHELERDIRTVAQRCIKAEDTSREGLAITRQIEEYSSRIGAQARLIDQLTERVTRLSDPNADYRSSPRPAAATFPASPRVEVLHLGNTSTMPRERNQASVCEVLKSLVSMG